MLEVPRARKVPPMRKSPSPGFRAPLCSLLLSLTLAACSASGSNGGSGGAASGGSSGSGGLHGSGGAGSGGRSGSGGTTGSGGTSSGGSSGSGGATQSGGTTGSGGTASGGAPGSGGGTTSGGTMGSGGTSGSGGAGGGTTPGGGGASGKGGAPASAGTGGGDDVVDAATMAVAMGFGTNIGNTFDNTTTWETGWGEPLVTQAYINGMASHGIKSVRVPVAWATYAVNGMIDATKMSRVKQVVGWIVSAGMYPILNIHWDGGWIYNEGNANQYKLTDDVKTKFASYWTQISAAFSDVGNKLVFEGLNEEGTFYVNGDSSGMPDYAALNALNQLFVTTVRAQAGYSKTRALLIAGFSTDFAKTCVDAFTVPDDPAGAGKLFLSLHYYTPYTFCGLDTVESWGSPKTTWGTDSEKAELSGLFSTAGAFSKQRKIPVIVGEFGVTLGTNYPRDPASRILWMETVAKAALSYGMVPVLWDTGVEISRTDGAFTSALQTVFKDLKL